MLPTLAVMANQPSRSKCSSLPLGDVETIELPMAAVIPDAKSLEQATRLM